MASLSLLLLLLSPVHPFSTLRPEWTVKSTHYMMSSSADILQCFPSQVDNSGEKSILLVMVYKTHCELAPSCVSGSSPTSLHLTHDIQPPRPCYSSNTPSLLPPQNLWFCGSLCLGIIFPGMSSSLASSWHPDLSSFVTISERPP